MPPVRFMAPFNHGAIRNATVAARRLAGFVGHRAREAALAPRLLRGRLGGAPRALFLPATAPMSSSLLRSYLVADALRDLGWATLSAPCQLEQTQRQRVRRLFQPHVSILRTARHPLNDARHMGASPFVLDIDDADFVNPALRARLERTCSAAAGVMAGSRHVAAWCRAHNPRVRVIWTGTPVTAGPRPPHALRAPIVTWAQADPTGYGAEFDFVTDIALAARARGGPFTLRLYGWRGGDDPRLARLRAGGVAVELKPTMNYDAFVLSLRECAVGLSPICAMSPFSRGKSFGKVLGYLDARTPVVASDEADHALFFDAASGVISNDPAVWAEAIARLVADVPMREAMAERAFAAFERRLSIAAATREVDAFLREIIAETPPPRG